MSLAQFNEDRQMKNQSTIATADLVRMAYEIRLTAAWISFNIGLIAVRYSSDLNEILTLIIKFCHHQVIVDYIHQKNIIREREEERVRAKRFAELKEHGQSMRFGG